MHGRLRHAPVLLVNNKQMHDYMSNEKIDQLIEDLKSSTRLDYGPDAILMKGLDGTNWRLKELPAEIMMKTDMDYDSIAKAGSMLGSGAVIVMDDTTCMVRALERLSYFYFEESCGQCTPCREGTGWLYRMVNRIENGAGPHGGPGAPRQRLRQHRRPHHLRAGRRRGAAGEELHQALPRRVRASHRAQDVPARVPSSRSGAAPARGTSRTWCATWRRPPSGN